MIPLDLDKIRKYLTSQPIAKAWLFGSFARGEQTPQSDVDLLVAFDSGAKISLLKHAGIMVDLEEILHRRVDIVREGTLYPEVASFVDSEKILIYERGA